MKSLKYIIGSLTAVILLASCEKRNTPAGLPEFEHHYYLVYVPNTNAVVSINRASTGLLKLPVQFYSAYTRPYDAVATYAIVTTGIANPAVEGVDFQITDANGSPLTTANGKFSMSFPQAIQKTDTIYVKPLNNTAPGVRRMEVQIQENITDQYRVDFFSTAFRRPVDFQ